MRILLYCFISFCVLTCKNQPSKTEVEESKLIKTFRYSNNQAPKISVHRGGKSIQNYPENCLETLQFVNDSIVGIYEIDVAKTKDGQLVLLHDNSIDRTTTGTGAIKDLEYSELKNFNLVDDFGNETTFKIPLFSDVLKWSKANNVVLSIDIKRSVPQKDVIDAIRAENAEDTSMVITYGLEQSISAHKLAPELLLSVSARNGEELDRLLKSKIPTKNMIAFTGTRLSDASLFKRLHDNDILTMLGTLGNLDKSAEARGDHLYNEWMALGADMIATDRPFAVSKTINNK